MSGAAIGIGLFTILILVVVLLTWGHGKKPGGW